MRWWVEVYGSLTLLFPLVVRTLSSSIFFSNTDVQRRSKTCTSESNESGEAETVYCFDSDVYTDKSSIFSLSFFFIVQDPLLFSGCSFYFSRDLDTGEANSIPRKDLERLVERGGGRVSDKKIKDKERVSEETGPERKCPSSVEQLLSREPRAHGFDPSDESRPFHAVNDEIFSIFVVQPTGLQ